jgi:hypothetical protein
MKSFSFYAVSLSAVFIAGFILRYAAVREILGPPLKAFPTMDEMDYREFAENILNYKEYSAWCQGFKAKSARAPVYPAVIAGVYKITSSHSTDVLKYLNLIFDFISILLVFLTAYFAAGKWQALIASGLYAFSGHAVFYMLQSSPHTIGVMLFLAVCLSILLLKRFYVSASVISGVLYALLIHTRPVFMVAFPFMYAAVFVQLCFAEKNEKREDSAGGRLCSSAFRKTLIKAALPVLIAGLLCLPWIIRNYREHHTFVPVCTIAGWHIANNINFDLKLSIKFFVEGLYAPERKNFTEGDYFRLAKDEFYSAFFSNPAKFILYGIGRLVYLWSPPEPYLRIFNPAAYVFPLHAGGITVPVPDFEGILYIFLTALIVMFFISGFSGIRSETGAALYKFRGPLVLAGGYALVHIIGIPLIAYRLFVEPVFIILAVNILWGFFCRIKNIRFDDVKNGKMFKYLYPFSLFYLYFIAFFVMFLVFVPLLTPAYGFSFRYPDIRYEDGVSSYAQIRAEQWNSLGNIQPGTKIKVMGITRYIHPGFKFVTDDYYAVADKNFSAGRLFCRYGSAENPTGTGDVRLNFGKGIPVPENGRAVILEGTARSGIFKEIIINVTKWHYITPTSHIP